MEPVKAPIEYLEIYTAPATLSSRKGSEESHVFNFPFQPYDIQVTLMRKAYEAYEECKFALLESPTGTGKSLSVICSSLSWLRDHQQSTRLALESKRDEYMSKIEDLKEKEELSGDWLTAQTIRQDIIRSLKEVEKQIERLDKFDGKNSARRHAKLHGVPLENYASFNVNNVLNTTVDGPLDETQDLNLIGGGASQESNKSEIEQDDDNMETKVAKQDEDHVRPKIFYASRTHSQLSQFVNEVKRTSFAKPKNLNEAPIKLAALASRANLCVNPNVLKLRDSNAINERCMEMQKETNKDKRCPYINAKLVNSLKEEILSEVYDIEDLTAKGRSTGACPYYASRMAIPEAELVVLPYNNLLHRETRQAASLDLKGNIVIVDEAHNILETICSIHSATISGSQLLACHTLFSRYYKRYRCMMSPRNAEVIKTIIQCLTAMIRYLDSPRQHIHDYENPKAVNLDESVQLGIESDNSRNITNDQGKIFKPASNHQELMIEVGQFAGASNIERFNVFKIIDYMNRSQLARKLLGSYHQDKSINLELETHDQPGSDSECQSPVKKKKKSRASLKEIPTSRKAQTTTSDKWMQTNLRFLVAQMSKCKQEELQMQSYPVYAMMEFLRALTNSLDDGKILTDYHQGDIIKSSLKFLLLNPSSQFKQMVDEARSIVLAGGTMQPFDEFIELLFGPLGVDESRLSLFSCGHVISPDHLYMASLHNGPTNKPLELSYRTKASFDSIDEIGRTIMNLSFVVPGGMVCFLPSYEYEHICFTRWSKIGIISKIETRSKQVFREPRQTSHLKPIFDEYAKMIERGKNSARGSLLFCVVGGKMSEGINFSDNLGRCVVMVGLPYANIKSCELREKMTYYDKACKKSEKGGPSAGQKYYENLCLKGINQSIGRAIRHKNDYAAVILLDRRYQTKTSIKCGLPKWMCQSSEEHERFGPLFAQLKSFFTHVQTRVDPESI